MTPYSVFPKQVFEEKKATLDDIYRTFTAVRHIATTSCYSSVLFTIQITISIKSFLA